MNLTLLYFIIAAAALAPAVALMWAVGTSRPWLFYGAEAWCVLVVALLAYFYLRAVRPVRRLSHGMDLLGGGDWNVRLRKVGQPEVDSISRVFNAMLERLQTQERRIREQNHFLSLLSEVAPVGIVVTKPDGTVALCNPCAARQLGQDGPGGDIEAAMATMTDGQDITLRLNARNIKRISRRHFNDSGLRHSFFIIADLSDVVADAEREGYEKLVRTISHEVNNTAGVLATALDSFELGADDADLARSCRERVLAMSNFVGAYAGVVKTGTPNAVRRDLGSVVANLRPFLESLCSRMGRTCLFSIDEPGARVALDSAQLEQVLVNIVKNACEASPEGAQIAVTCRGNVLTVANPGPEIAPEVAARLFSPFFSTKPTGQGIGLTLTREVLDGHGADYSLTSSEGTTTFRIVFPLAR